MQVCEEKPTPFRFAGLASLGFSRLTWCPLQRKMLALEVRSFVVLLSFESHIECIS